MKCRLVAFYIACRDYLCTLRESTNFSPHFLQHQAFILQHIRTSHTVRVCPVPSTESEFTCAPASLRTDNMERLTASSVVQVAVGDLEWSLMSIYSTHQQLQAARAKQQRLLKTLNEVSSLKRINGSYLKVQEPLQRNSTVHRVSNITVCREIHKPCRLHLCSLARGSQLVD